MIKNKYAIYKRSKHNECVSTQDRVLRLLYGNRAGRMVLGWLIRPEVSKLVGRFMDTGLSRIMINPFIKKNDIDISVCQKNEFDSYNDFFKRKLVPGARTIDMTDEGFVSPCDSRLTVYDIEDTERQTFNIKDSEYTVASLLRDKKLARHYRGGKLWLFRLCVDDYHRYIYNVSGKQSDVRRLEGLYHTVNPIASEYYDIYKENTREYCLIRTQDAGTIIDMVNIEKQYNLPVEKRELPVFVANVDGATKYILPIYGAGLWGPIWGYISLDDNKDTVYGTFFDHQGETPGLGAEITTPEFNKEFRNKQIFSGNQLVGILVVKGGNASGANEVDAISGGTYHFQRSRDHDQELLNLLRTVFKTKIK